MVENTWRSFRRGSLSSFGIANDFGQGPLDYLNNSEKSKSINLAKYCSIGLKAEMDESIIISTSEYPVNIWARSCI